MVSAPGKTASLSTAVSPWHTEVGSAFHLGRRKHGGGWAPYRPVVRNITTLGQDVLEHGTLLLFNMSARNTKRSVKRSKKRDLTVAVKGGGRLAGIGSANGEVALAYKRAPLAKSKRTAAMQPRTNGSKAFIVKHTEYLADLTAVNPGFDVTSYPINPGIGSTFPWLASLAANFDQYRIRSLCARFESSAPATENGRVFMAFDYDPQDQPPVDKGSFMSYKGATSDAVWTSNMVRFIGPRLGKIFYTRTGGVVGDIRLYDAGNFFVSTSGVANGVLCGELYLDYEIELVNPQGASACGGETYTAATISSTSSTGGGNPLTHCTSNEPTKVSIDDSTHFSIHAPGNYVLAVYALWTSGTPSSGTYFNIVVSSGTATVGGYGYGYNTAPAGVCQSFLVDQNSTDAQFHIVNNIVDNIAYVFSMEVAPASH